MPIDRRQNADSQRSIGKQEADRWGRQPIDLVTSACYRTLTLNVLWTSSPCFPPFQLRFLAGITCLYPAWVDAIVGVVADRIPRVCARAVISDRTKTTDADRRRLGRSPSSDSRHVWPTFVLGHYMCNGNGPANRKGLVRSGAIQSFAWQPAVSRPDYGAIESLSAWDGFDNHRG